jgi:hypothetical protein
MFAAHSVQNLLSSSLPSKNVKIKIYRTIILPVALYWCETLSLAVEGGMLAEGGPKRVEVTGEWRRLHKK